MSKEKVSTTKTSEPAPKKVSFFDRFNVRLSTKEKLFFSKYLSVLLDSGMAIDQAITVLQERSKGPLGKVLKRLNGVVKNGEALSEGMKLYPWIFDPVYLNLVRAGEKSGTLVKNLQNITAHIEKDVAMKRKIVGAMAYPSVVLVAAIGIALAIILFVLPNIAGLFESLNAELPLPTRILLWISSAFDSHGILILIISIVSVIAIFVLRSLSFVKPFTHLLLLRVPILGNLSRKINLARMTQLMGTMMKNGITIDEALKITQEVLSNVRYKKMFKQARAEVSEGTSLYVALKKYPLLVPPIALHIINVGEKTGALDGLLIYLAGFYEQEVDDLMSSITNLIEPILILSIGLLVGGLALAILTPIYSVIDQF